MTGGPPGDPQVHLDPLATRRLPLGSRPANAVFVPLYTEERTAVLVTPTEIYPSQPTAVFVSLYTRHVPTAIATAIATATARYAISTTDRPRSLPRTGGTCILGACGTRRTGPRRTGALVGARRLGRRRGGVAAPHFPGPTRRRPRGFPGGRKVAVRRTRTGRGRLGEGRGRRARGRSPRLGRVAGCAAGRGAANAL